MEEITPAQFDVLAKILRSSDKVRLAAKMVIMEHRPVKEAVEQTGMLHPAVSRTVKRYRLMHQLIRSGYSEALTM